jgi:predicted dehydrogenase/sugar phosphate isomerase/epimerase
MAEEYKAVQIGCGARSPWHSKALADIKRINFVATCDRNKERAESSAKEYGAPSSYTDVDEMMKKENPDIIAIVTQPGDREALITQLVQYKPKGIVLEKPLGICLAEAENIVQMCADAGTELVLCHQSRYSDEMMKIKGFISEGRFGKIQKVIINSKMNLLAQGTHLVDLMMMMLPDQKPTWVLGQVDGTDEIFKKIDDRIWHSPHAVHPSADHASFQVGFEDNEVTVFGSLGSLSPTVPNCEDFTLEFQVTVIGEKGFGSATLSKEWVACFDDGKTERGEVQFYDTDSYMTIPLYEDLLDVIEGKLKEHQTSGRSALEVQRIINAVEESVIQNRAIQLPYWPNSGTHARLRNRLAAQKDLIVSTLLFPNQKREQFLEPIAKAGFQNVDLWSVDDWGEHFDENEDGKKIIEEFKALGLSCPMISYFDFGSEDKTHVKKKLQIAKDLGAKVAISLGINATRDPKGVKALKEELDLAYELGIKIAFENHYDFLETIQDMKDFLELLDYHPAAHICLAPPHLALYGETPEEALYELRERIAVCYLWDYEAKTTVTDADLERENNWWENGRAQTPGGGDLDMHSYLTAAGRYAPEALWSLTWHGTYDWDFETIMRSLKQGARQVEKHRPLNVDSVNNRHFK